MRVRISSAFLPFIKRSVAVVNALFWLIPILAVCALCFAAYKANYVSKAPAGTPRMQEIAAARAEGADAFLMSEYKILAVFIAVLFL